MNPALSPNTQAILLLTAPLIAGRGSSSPDLLSPREYKDLARRLRDMQRQPADLLSPEAADVLHDCRPVVENTRLLRLLERGFLLSQVIERWQTRAIWVTSRADADYPLRLKARLREDAPAVLYGCGDKTLLETGGLAVVGSRNASETLLHYTTNVGRLAASAGITVISGGAKGVDQTAMLSALNEGGKVIGVLADTLERSAMTRENRDALISGRLLLVSPYDPNAGFNTGNAMQRNKLIYALADASLVVSSDLNKGGTWAGATEQLDKLRMVPIYVRSIGEHSAGIDALHTKGAIPWPEPRDTNALRAVFDSARRTIAPAAPAKPSLFSNDPAPAAISNIDPPTSAETQSTPKTGEERLPPEAAAGERPCSREPTDAPEATAGEPEPNPECGQASAHGSATPADILFETVRGILQQLLISPMNDAEIAGALGVTIVQARAWLLRLVEAGALEKHKKRYAYTGEQRRLFR
jgi:DNA processing protein